MWLSANFRSEPNNNNNNAVVNHKNGYFVLFSNDDVYPLPIELFYFNPSQQSPLTLVQIQYMIEIIFRFVFFISVLDVSDLSVWKVKWRMAYGVEQLEPPVLNRSQRVQAAYEIRICLAAL